jgi:hypothetical protein
MHALVIYIGWRSAEGQKLKQQIIIFKYFENLGNQLCNNFMPSFYLTKVLSMCSLCALYVHEQYHALHEPPYKHYNNVKWVLGGINLAELINKRKGGRHLHLGYEPR